MTGKNNKNKKKKGHGENTGNQTSQRTLRSSTSTRTEDHDNLREFGVDLESIQATILARVNQTLSANSTSYGSVGGSAGGGVGSPTSTTDTSKMFLDQILPAIVTSVAIAVEQVLMTALKKHRAAEERVADEEVRRLQRRMVLLKFENDRLEQYSRRETLRIVGLQEEKGENVEQKVIDLFTATGADVTTNDISVVHRTGGGRQRGGPRHILVRFISRRKRREVMVAKKNLKEKDNYKGVFINDDLTPMRSRLLGYVKESQRFGRVWSSDGRILCLKKLPTGVQRDQNERPLVIETADDLFDAGFDNIDPVRLGVQDWYVPCVDDEEDEDDDE